MAYILNNFFISFVRVHSKILFTRFENERIVNSVKIDNIFILFILFINLLLYPICDNIVVFI